MKKTYIIICLICIIFTGFGLVYVYVNQAQQRSQPNQEAFTEDMARSLQSIPYVVWTPVTEQDRQKKGVIFHNPDLAYSGINIYSSESLSGAYLLDMDGNRVHTFIDRRYKKSSWKLIKPYRYDTFLVLIENSALFLIDWQSNIKWIRHQAFHHDVTFDDMGNIYALTNIKATFPILSPDKPIRDNGLVMLTPKGDIKRQLSFAKMVATDPHLSQIARSQKQKHYYYGKDAWDIFHTNTLQVINRPIVTKTGETLKNGQIMFCIRNLNIIGVVDIAQKRIVWHWGENELDYPHHPTILENGNILIFDNGYFRKYSRVIELNPTTEEIEWEFTGDPPESFYTPLRGSAQRLPNGNTLIAESDNGRSFEITPDGEIVWELFSLELNKKKNKRATIYRMTRLADPGHYAHHLK